MKYIRVENNFEQIKLNIIERFLAFLLPKTNSMNIDTDSIFYWLLEVEGLSVKREIGFDKEDTVIYKAPSDQNYGVWSDSFFELNNIKKYEKINETVFESYWECPSQTTC